MRWWINGIGQLILGILGFITNSVSISILIRGELSTTFNHLLACLAFSDNMHYICSVAMSIMTLFFANQSIRGTYFPQFHSVWFMCSSYIFLGLVTERFLALSQPQKYFDTGTPRKSSWKRIILYTLPVLFFSIVYHLPIFLEIEFGEFEVSGENRTINWKYTDLHFNETFKLWYKNICRVIFRGILPFFILLFANYKLILAAKNMRKYFSGSRRYKSFEVRQAHSLIVIVTVNFVNFFLYCAKKAYLLFVFKANTVAGCTVSPSILSEAVEAAQVL